MGNFVRRRYEILKKLRKISRIVSVLFIISLLVILVNESFDALKLSPTEWLRILYFPFGVIAGLIIAWKYEVVGGTISILSLATFYFLYPFEINEQFPQIATFLIFSVPAILFLISGNYAYFAIGKLADRVSDNAIRH